jgi:hypothetical protein
MARSGGAVVHKWHGVALSLRARRTGQDRAGESSAAISRCAPLPMSCRLTAEDE